MREIWSLAREIWWKCGSLRPYAGDLTCMLKTGSFSWKRLTILVICFDSIPAAANTRTLDVPIYNSGISENIFSILMTRWGASIFHGRMLSGLQAAKCIQHISHLENLCAAADMKTLYVSVDDLFVHIYFHFDQAVKRRENEFIYRCWAHALIKALPNSLILSCAYCGACAHPVHSFGGTLHQSWWCREAREGKGCNRAAQRPSNKIQPALPQLHPACHEWPWWWSLYRWSTKRVRLMLERSSWIAGKPTLRWVVDCRCVSLHITRQHKSPYRRCSADQLVAWPVVVELALMTFCRHFSDNGKRSLTVRRWWL